MNRDNNQNTKDKDFLPKIRRLKRILEDSKRDSYVRAQAARALGEIGGSEVVFILLNFLDNEDFLVQEAVAEALGKIGDQDLVLPIIKEWLPSLDERRRTGAAMMLGELRAVEAADFLMKLLRREKEKEESLAIDSIIIALGKIGETQAIPVLMELLNKNRSFFLQQLAAQALKEIGDRSIIPRLKKGLLSFNKFRRAGSAMALGVFQVKEALEPLIQLLMTDLEKGPRAAAAYALGELKDPRAVEALYHALGDEWIFTQIVAAEALGKIGDRSIIPKLIEGLFKDEKRKYGILVALRHLPTKEAAGPLIELLKQEKDYQIRNEIITTMAVTENPQAVAPLLQIIEEEIRWFEKKTPNPETKELEEMPFKSTTMMALGRLRIPQAVEALLQFLGHKLRGVRREAADVLGEVEDRSFILRLLEGLSFPEWQRREGSARALGNLQVKEAVEPLLNALKDEIPSVRREAARALGLIGDPRAVKPLLQALQDEEVSVRAAAVEALGEFDDPEIVGPLIQALGDKDKKIRAAAAYALGKIGTPEAIGPLSRALKDEDDAVRAEAAEALGKIEVPESVEPLIQALYDEDSLVRITALKSLTKVGDARVLDVIDKIIEEGNWKPFEELLKAHEKIRWKIIERMIKEDRAAYFRTFTMEDY